MNKLFTFLFAAMFAVPCFATGVSGSAGTCDTGALGTDNGSTILRANYEPETIHLRWYDENNNLLTVNSTSQSCIYGESITIPTAPSKTGYRFTGWSVFSDYTPIEYLESTGTQWIDTGYSPNSNTKVEIKTRLFNSNFDWPTLIGALDLTNDHYIEYSLYGARGTNYLYYTFGQTAAGTDNDITCSVSFDTDHIIIAEKNTLTVDNVLCNQGQNPTFNLSSTMYLFARNYTGSADMFFSTKIYYVKIWDNNALVRDMIPVKDIHGVACMYDKVTGQFFYNAGTGDFVAGPEI